MKFKFRNVMKKTTLLLSIFAMTVSPMASYAGEFEYINKFGTLVLACLAFHTPHKGDGFLYIYL